MKFLIMRHGEAVDPTASMSDGERWLTEKGRRVTREVAAWIAEHHRPAALWTSPLVRATQTAEIVASALGFEGEVRVVREIAQGNDARLTELLRRYDGDGPLLVVGHEPTLSGVVQRVLDDERWPGFDKSGVCGLKWDGEHPGRFDWALLPKKLRVVDALEKLQG